MVELVKAQGLRSDRLIDRFIKRDAVREALSAEGYSTAAFLLVPPDDPGTIYEEIANDPSAIDAVTRQHIAFMLFFTLRYLHPPLAGHEDYRTAKYFEIARTESLEYDRERIDDFRVVPPTDEERRNIRIATKRAVAALADHFNIFLEAHPCILLLDLLEPQRYIVLPLRRPATLANILTVLGEHCDYLNRIGGVKAQLQQLTKIRRNLAAARMRCRLLETIADVEARIASCRERLGTFDAADIQSSELRERVQETTAELARIDEQLRTLGDPATARADMEHRMLLRRKHKSMQRIDSLLALESPARRADHAELTTLMNDVRRARGSLTALDEAHPGRATEPELLAAMGSILQACRDTWPSVAPDRSALASQNPLFDVLSAWAESRGASTRPTQATSADNGRSLGPANRGDILKTLGDLFMALFDARELRQFIAFLPEGVRLDAHLPGDNASLATLAHEAVMLLERHGFVPEPLGNQLIKAFPRREHEIRVVWYHLGIS